MAVRFILMMALMMVGYGHPGPNESINIGIKQIVNAGAGCGNGCCDCKSDLFKTTPGPEDCHFDHKSYPNEKIFTIRCQKLFCFNKKWVYLGRDNKCGRCKADEDPRIYPFDEPPGPRKYYRFLDDGTYVLTQPSFHNPPRLAYGVYGDFITQGVSNLQGVTYFEDDPVLTPIVFNVKCDLVLDVCKLYMGSSKTMEPLKPFPGTSYDSLGGTIWVFEHSGVYGTCIIIMGTHGLTVKVCPIAKDGVPIADIYALESLKSSRSKLYGLCNTYTGSLPSAYVAEGGAPYTYPKENDGAFIKSWKDPVPP